MVYDQGSGYRGFLIKWPKKSIPDLDAVLRGAMYKSEALSTFDDGAFSWLRSGCDFFNIGAIEDQRNFLRSKSRLFDHDFLTFQDSDFEDIGGVWGLG